MTDIQVFAFFIIPLMGLGIGLGLAWWALRESQRRLPGE